MNDNMSAYSAIAQSYRELPLIALRELESVLRHEIEERECSFGMRKNTAENEAESEVSVGDVWHGEAAYNREKSTNNNVLIGNFKGSKV